MEGVGCKEGLKQTLNNIKTKGLSIGNLCYADIQTNGSNQEYMKILFINKNKES